MAGKLSVKAKGKELSVGRQAYTSAQLRRPRMCGVAAGSTPRSPSQKRPLKPVGAAVEAWNRQRSGA